MGVGANRIGKDESTTFFLYEPPHHGWPYYLVVRWPSTHAKKWLERDSDATNRGRYTVETYATYEEALTDSAKLLDSLRRKGFVIEVVSYPNRGLNTRKPPE